jgi:hypothetical protein
MPDVQDQDAAQARRQLSLFLSDLEDLLDTLLRDRPELIGYAHGAMASAWVEVKPRFQVVNRELFRVTYGETADQEESSLPRPAEVDAHLREHGLTGVQLELKLDQYGAAAAALIEELASADEAERYWQQWLGRLRGSRAAGWVKRRLQAVRAIGRRSLQSKFGRLFRIANNILDSLGDALNFVPGVGAAAKGIKEFKDALEVAVEEPDERPKSRDREATWRSRKR